MEIVIRENMEQHMQELKQWITETAEVRPEEMSSFFSARIAGYEEHMSTWALAYKRFAELLPPECENILDLGCGTGLELDEIYKLHPRTKVTGVDLCQDMLDHLWKKHADKEIKLICTDYFQYDMTANCWDSIISFESLHHFLPHKKKQIYEKTCQALKENALLIIGDYVACCEEEELLLQNVYLQKRAEYQIPEEQFIHLDIPLTLEHEFDLLHSAGFSTVWAAGSINGATLICARK